MNTESNKQNRNPLLKAAAIVAIIVAVGLVAQAKAMDTTPEPVEAPTAGIEGFLPVVVGDFLVAICSTCNPEIEVTAQRGGEILYAEYRQDPSVPMASYNFFNLIPLTSWCTDGGGALELHFDRGAIMPVTIPASETMVCGYTPLTVTSHLSFPDHAYFAVGDPRTLAAAIGYPDAFILTPQRTR